MPNLEPFRYRELFAKSAPAPQNRTVARRGKYDFAVAYPDPASLPLDDLVESLRIALQEEGEDLAVYPHPQGYPPLREFIADKLARNRDIHVSHDDIFLGDGSGQPIHMLAEALLDPGDVVVVDDFVYSGTLATLRRFRADIRGIPSDREGMLPDALESTLSGAIAEGKRPKFIYVIPTFQNPQGWTMTLDRRLAIVRLSQQHNVPILEDDCYVDLQYDGTPVTSIHSLDDTGRVMYVSSFSKVIAPGMRMGYLTAAPEVLNRIAGIKSGGGTNQFAALAIHRYATVHLDNHVRSINNILRNKRNAMLTALGENFGSEATWSSPDGGLYTWLKMSPGTDLVSIHAKALDANVGYQVGPVFAADSVSGKNCARLCFGYNTPTEIHEGIARLADVFDQAGILRS